MASKIKVDTIENVAGSGNVSLGSGHNLVVPGNNSTTGNATVGGTLGVTGTSALTGNTTVGGTLGVTGTATLSGNATIGTNSGDTRFSLNSANQYTMVLKNAGNIAGQIGGGGADDLRFSNAAGATTMQIKDGRITKPLQPAFLARVSGTQFNSSGTTPFNSVSGNGGFNRGGHFNTTTHKFTAPVAGVYEFSVHLICATTLTNGQMKFQVNGSDYQQYHVTQANTNWHFHQFHGIFNLAANDAVNFKTNETVALYGSQWAGFGGFLVG